MDSQAHQERWDHLEKRANWAQLANQAHQARTPNRSWDKRAPRAIVATVEHQVLREALVYQAQLAKLVTPDPLVHQAYKAPLACKANREPVVTRAQLAKMPTTVRVRSTAVVRQSRPRRQPFKHRCRPHTLVDTKCTTTHR